MEIKIVEQQETNVEAINRLHDEIWTAFGKAVEAAIPKAIDIGERLAEFKVALGHGEWEPWVDANLIFNTRQAWKYMRIFSKRNEIANLHSNGDLTIDQAVALLSGPQAALVSKFTGNQENYTPKEVIDNVRSVLGDIDLDPASCELSQQTVKAGRHFTEKEDGLSKPWFGRVFLNPPYQQPLIADFIDKLIEELPHIEAAILLTNNNTDTKWFVKSARAAALICLTTGRIKFYTEETEGTQPVNGQAFFYFGDKTQDFKNVFCDVGMIMRIIK